MNFDMVNELMENSGVLELMTSLPIVIVLHGQHKVVWFNFSVEPYEGSMVGIVYDVFLLGEDMQVENIKPGLRILLRQFAGEEPQLGEEDYLKCIEAEYQDMDAVSCLERLRETILAPLLPIYEAVISMCLEEE